MATHSSILAWRFPQTEQPGGCRTHKVSDTTQHLSTHARTPQSAQAEIPASTAPQRLPQGGEGRGCNRAQSDPSRPAGAYSRSGNTLNRSPENYGVAQRQNQGDIWGFWPRLLCSCSKLKLAFLPVSIYQLSFEPSQLMWKKMWLPGIVENPSPSISLFPENSDICQPSSGELFQVQEMC